MPGPYDRLVGADANGHLPPTVAAQLKGDKGDTGDEGVGVASITDPDEDGMATVTLTDGTTSTLPLPRGPKGDKGDTGPAQSITTSTPSAGLTRITWI